MTIITTQLFFKNIYVMPNSLNSNEPLKFQSKMRDSAAVRGDKQRSHGGGGQDNPRRHAGMGQGDRRRPAGIIRRVKIAVLIKIVPARQSMRGRIFVLSSDKNGLYCKTSMQEH